MAKDELSVALAELRAETESIRLSAARRIRKHAGELTAESEAVVREAFAEESVPWVRGVLAEILAIGAPPVGEEVTIAAPRWDERIEGTSPEVARQAINHSTRKVLHEVAGVVGRARLAAGTDFGEDYPDSETDRQLRYLSDVCGGLRKLADATVNPSGEEFDLDTELRYLAKSVADDLFIEIRVEGPANFMVKADRALLGIAIRNLLTNAAEATEAVHPNGDRAVQLTWGESSDGVHVSVIDRGPGPPAFLARTSRPGISTKVGHPGYGLATASEAMRGIGGEVRLSRNNRGGATAVISWPSADA